MFISINTVYFQLSPAPPAEEGSEEAEADPIHEKMETIKKAVFLEITGGGEGGGTDTDQASPNIADDEGPFCLHAVCKY